MPVENRRHEGTEFNDALSVGPKKKDSGMVAGRVQANVTESLVGRNEEEPFGNDA